MIRSFRQRLLFDRFLRLLEDLRLAIKLIDRPVNQDIKRGLTTARLKQVTINFESPVKYAEDVDIPSRLDEIGDSIMAIEENTDVQIRITIVAVPNFRKPLQHLRFFIYAFISRAARITSTGLVLFFSGIPPAHI